MKHILPVLLLFITHTGFSQKLSEADSLLRRKYYHQVYLKAIQSKADFLYTGIDNPLEIHFPDEFSKGMKYMFKTHNGMIFESNSNTYITIPKNAGRAFISAYIITERKDTILVGKKEYTVFNVPIPVLKIGNELIKDQSLIDKMSFLRGDSLKVFFTDDLLTSNEWCTVEFFNLGYTYGGRYISVDNKGAMLSKATLDFINNLRSNQMVTIKVSSIRCSMIFKNFPFVRFKIK